MSASRASGRLLSRLPALMVAFGIAAFVFYFLFLRHGRSPAAEAAPPAAIETPAEAAAASPAEPPVPVAEEKRQAAPAAEEPVQAPQTEPPPPAAPADLFPPAEKFFDSRADVARLFTSDIPDSVRSDVATKAIALNQQLLVTHPEPRDVELADIRSGENLTTFSRRFAQLHGEYGIVQLVNNIKNPAAVRAGSKLRVPRGVWSLFVDKSLFTLYLCYQGTPYKIYRVCVGADEKTPAAAFTVGIKNPKPVWYAPPDWLEHEKVKNPVPYGHPKNPLGEYWIGIDHPIYTGFGIHGTNQPETIGTKASMGCVRMLNEDVIELARIAWKGMDVTIVE
ncbi:MAG: L,D-transpeptidase [Planctomycetes bacterium]|nr:L,D-transpeptidase [Planctomycetota bacterium]